MNHQVMTRRKQKSTKANPRRKSAPAAPKRSATPAPPGGIDSVTAQLTAIAETLRAQQQAIDELLFLLQGQQPRRGDATTDTVGSIPLITPLPTRAA